MIANGASEKTNVVKNVTLKWSDLLARIEKFPVSPGNRSYMMAGHVPSGVRGSKNGQPIEQTTLLMLDLDGEAVPALTFNDLVDALEFSMPYAFAAYTTRSYDGGNVRFRIIIPFTSPLPASQHRAAVGRIAAVLPESVVKHLDSCSYNPEQPIFLPCVSAEGNPRHSASVEGEPFDPASMGLESEQTDFLDDLDSLILAQPLDLTLEEIDTYLDALDPNAMEYGLDQVNVFGWGNVGAALHHQFGGSDEGYARWVKFSERNKEKHKERAMRGKWESFSIVPRGKRPTTFASVIHAVGERGGIGAPVVLENGEVVISDALDNLLVEASTITNYADFKVFAKRVSAIPELVLGATERSLIAKELSTSEALQGKGATLTDLRKEIAPQKKARPLDGETMPDWCEGWCYIECTNMFHLMGGNHEINKEAFNARFNRMPECKNSEIGNAASLALEYWNMPTFADTLYWPGAGETFERDGQSYVNLYSTQGLPVPEVPTADDLEAIAIVEKHFELIVSDDNERNILINWLAQIVQRPGQRLTWAIFLQGAQGIGKSFIQVMMTHLIGRNVRVLEASNLAGRFTGWAHGATLIVVEEVRVAGESKYVVEDRMKPLISNDVIQIEEKGRDHREVPNFSNYLLLSNHKDALPLQSGDRRYAVIFSDLQTEEDLFAAVGGGPDEVAEYFDRLFGALENHTGAIAWWLATRKIPADFKPKGRAPKTKSFVEALSLSESHQGNHLEDMIMKHACAVVGPDLVDTAQLIDSIRSAGDDEIPNRTLSKGLLESGYTKLGKRIYIKELGKKTSVWYKRKAMNEDRATEIVTAFYAKAKTGGADDFDDFSDVPF